MALAGREADLLRRLVAATRLPVVYGAAGRRGGGLPVADAACWPPRPCHFGGARPESVPTVNLPSAACRVARVGAGGAQIDQPRGDLART